MKGSKKEVSHSELYQIIVDYVGQSNGLKAEVPDSGQIKIIQSVDGKSIQFMLSELDEVLTRFDSSNKSFIQVNFLSGKKILLTEELIGFKPIPQVGLDPDKLPKVVTTPDLISVFEAVEEALSSESSNSEIDSLKKVFYSILFGAEDVGFELHSEKEWFRYLNVAKASA